MDDYNLTFYKDEKAFKGRQVIRGHYVLIDPCSEEKIHLTKYKLKKNGFISSENNVKTTRQVLRRPRGQRYERI